MPLALKGNFRVVQFRSPAEWPLTLRKIAHFWIGNWIERKRGHLSFFSLHFFHTDKKVMFQPLSPFIMVLASSTCVWERHSSRDCRGWKAAPTNWAKQRSRPKSVNYFLASVKDAKKGKFSMTWGKSRFPICWSPLTQTLSPVGGEGRVGVKKGNSCYTTIQSSFSTRCR